MRIRKLVAGIAALGIVAGTALPPITVIETKGYHAIAVAGVATTTKAVVEQRPLAVGITAAARIIGISVSMVWKLISEGRLRTTKVGSRRLVMFASLEELLEAGEVKKRKKTAGETT